jgi:plasmid stabilization system protein ParE
MLARRAPFRKHLIFYRYDGTAVSIERVVHGARDLALRLTESPDI